MHTVGLKRPVKKKYRYLDDEGKNLIPSERSQGIHEDKLNVLGGNIKKLGYIS